MAGSHAPVPQGAAAPWSRERMHIPNAPLTLRAGVFAIQAERSCCGAHCHPTWSTNVTERRGERSHIARSGASGADGGSEQEPNSVTQIVEHVMLFRMDPALPLQQEQEFLDHLYTLQYHYRHVLSTSLGRVFSKVSDGYTHGAVVRLPSRAHLQEFLGHPALKEVREKYVDPFCKGSVSLSFEAQVDNDLEMLFRRGESFESGVEHLVFVKPKEGATPQQQQDLLSALNGLPSKVDSIVQLTAGPVVGAASPEAGGFSHALIVRLPSEEDLSAYNRHPAHREIIRKQLLPIAERILSVDFSVDPVGQESPV